MFGVVTGLVVVHLGRRVIWSKRRKGRVRSCTPGAPEQSTCTFPVCLQRAGSPAALRAQL